MPTATTTALVRILPAALALVGWPATSPPLGALRDDPAVLRWLWRPLRSGAALRHPAALAPPLEDSEEFDPADDEADDGERDAAGRDQAWPATRP